MAHTVPPSLACVAMLVRYGLFFTFCKITLLYRAMWPMFDDQGEGGQRRPLMFQELVARMGDFSDLMMHDKALQFWLPEPAEVALGEMAERNTLTKSEFLRQFFAVHCYGLYAFYAMTEAMPELFKEPSGKLSGVFYQMSKPEPLPLGKKRIKIYWVPELGKNIAPLKVWMPRRLKDNLTLLANHANLTPSNYARELVISRLLGHGMLPTRPEMFRMSETPAAEAWCNEKDVPMRQVSEAEYIKSTAGEEHLKVVDDVRA